MKPHVFRIHFILLSGLCFALSLHASIAVAANSGVTYQGRIVKPDGTALSGVNTQFKMQIRTPDSNNCLLYEELQSQDLSHSNGVFALTINDGTGTRTDTTTFNLDRIFSNSGSFTFDPSTCSAGSSYTPSTGDGRNLVVLFKDETMSAWEPIPAQKINFVPFAFESKQVQGFNAASLVRVQDSGGTYGNISPLSNANYTELLALINGTTTQYSKASQLGGVALPTMNSGEVLGWNGTSWVSTAAAGGANSVSSTMLQASSVTTNAIANNVSISTTGTLASAITTTRDFKIYAASPSTYSIDMQAPALTASYSLVWPMNAGTSGQILTTDGSGNLSWTTGLSQWTTTGSNISYSTGSVGIGTTSPAASLHIERDGVGATTAANLYSNPALALINATPATSGVDQPVGIRLTGQAWNSTSGVSQTADWVIGGQPTSQSQPNAAFNIWNRKNGGAWSEILSIDSYGQFYSPFQFASFDAQANLNQGLRLSNDALTTASVTQQYSPYIRMYGSGWATTPAANQNMSVGAVVAPQQGSSSALGVYKLFYGTNTATPLEANELVRYQWGDKLGVTFNQNSLANYTVGINGNVGIGTTSPNAVLQVNGTITGKAAVSNSGSTIDFSTGNSQYTANDCGAYVLTNMKDGGSYVFAVQGANATTCSFTAYSDSGSTALTVHLPPNHGQTTASSHTLYNFVVLGTHVYTSWTPGY